MAQDPELVRRFRRRRYRQQQLLFRMLIPVALVLAGGFDRMTEALLLVVTGLIMLMILQLACIRDMLGYLCSHVPEEAEWRYRLLEEVSELRGDDESR